METTLTLPNNIHTYYHKGLLEAAKNNLKLWGLGKKKIHPRGNGVDSYMLKFGHVASSTSELTEGVVPSSATIATNKYTVTVKQYGKYLSLSDKLIMTAIDPVLEDVSDELGYTAAKSTDEIIRDHLLANATSNIQYASTAVSDATVTSAMTFIAQDAIKAVRELDAQDAPSIDGEYIWVVPSRVASDIMADTSAGGFQELNKYVAGLADKPLNGEIGKVYQARIVKSNAMTYVANAGSVNVYRTLMFAKDAFACTSFDKDHVDLIVKQLGAGGTSDPLNQIATVGYKLQFGVKYVGGQFSNHNGASPDLCLQIRGAATGG